MRTTGKRLAILAATIFAAAAFITVDAAAEVLFDATLHTPDMSIHVGSTPAACHRVIRDVRPLPPRGRMHPAFRHDIAVAERLAWYTGTRAGELLKYRRYGYTWHEIGRWLDIPARAVRCAMNEHDWNMYIGRLAYRDGYRYHKDDDGGRRGNGQDRHDRGGRG